MNCSISIYANCKVAHVTSAFLACEKAKAFKVSHLLTSSQFLRLPTGIEWITNVNVKELQDRKFIKLVFNFSSFNSQQMFTVVTFD